MNKNKKWKNMIGGILSTIFVIMPSFVFAEEMLVPVGQTVGVTMNMKGVTVVDIADVDEGDGRFVSPAGNAGIRVGDVIESVDGKSVTSAKDFDEMVSNAKDELTLVAHRDGKKKTFSVKPIRSSQDKKFQLGIWVKDTVSGIGTVTYLNPKNGEFGGLGHGIAENKNGEVVNISQGEIVDARIVSVQKSGKGQPGELVGVFSDQDKVLGYINENTEVGIKGVVIDGELKKALDAIPVAKREEVKIGTAEMLSNIEDGKIERFQVEIQKINRDSKNPKGMVVKITDKKLLEKTGGIVQGMSGSPILQNGKLVGAVTHVFVNDPTRGYGIFIENMLAESEKVK